jgi:hypothetical protein
MLNSLKTSFLLFEWLDFDLDLIGGSPLTLQGTTDTGEGVGRKVAASCCVCLGKGSIMAPSTAAKQRKVKLVVYAVICMMGLLGYGESHKRTLIFPFPPH